MRKALVHVALLGTLLAPALVSAAAPKNFCELVNFFVTIFNALTGLFVMAALVTYLYGISTNVRAGETSKRNLKTIILWGLLGLFVMVSVWGLLRILQETLFQSAPGTPAQSGRTC